MAGIDPDGPVASAVAAGIEHVRLSYGYLDRGDIDGFGSLLAPDAVLLRPGGRDVRGRAAIERWLASSGARGTSTVFAVYATGGNVIVVGHHTGHDRDGHLRDVEFTDFFTIAPDGLLRTVKRYFFLEVSG